MEWDIVINDEPKYIEVITRGIGDKDSSLNMTKAFIDEMKARKIKKILIDHRNLEKVVGSTLDIYERPQLISDSIGPEWGIKIALIVKPEHWEHFKFLETVFVNRGFLASLFQNKEGAISWLISYKLP